MALSTHVGRLIRRLAGLMSATCVVVAFATVGTAAADQLQVTYVARQCPSFGNIYANRARNDIQESLEDLGPNSQYLDSGTSFLVNPDAEELPPEDECEPITGWRFTLGTGIVGRAVDGPWGSLSKVTNPFDTVIQTQDEVPLLNQNGDQLDNRTIAGAVTVTLTDAESSLAGSDSSLWVQGGIPDDPVLARTFALPDGSPQYAFGALRCGVDALNGDNVEYIYFPSGVKHVFCYALYVTPPPTAGTITIRKQVVGAPADEEPAAFHFGGDLSFDPNGFTLADGQSADFPRAGGSTWNVTESPVDGFALDSVQCSATTQANGPPTSTWTISGAETSITLQPREHVTCVYTNRFVPPHGGLTIAKITRGGTGRFGYVVSGDGATHRAHATTTQPRVPANAEPSLLSLAPGTYTIRERRPSSRDGTWQLAGVRCDGERVTRRPVRVEIRSGEGTVCVFVNVFHPRGSISLEKVTYGGTGTAKFVIDPRRRPATQQYLQHATTAHEGVSVHAVPDTPADATHRLRLGRYTIVEQPPLVAGVTWKLQTVICNGVVEPFDRGAVTVTLTPSHPRVHCRFANAVSLHPLPDPPPVFPPPPPPPVNPPGGGAAPDPVYPITDLEATKRASTSTVRPGHAVTFRLTVRNISRVPAQQVVVSDQTIQRETVLSLHNPRGTCRAEVKVACPIGNLQPGASVVLTARIIPGVTGRRFVNRVAVGTGTQEDNLANNVGSASVRVLPARRPRVTG